MTSMQIEIPKPGRSCCLSGDEIKPGDVYYSVLIETEQGVERRDYAERHWKGPPPETISFWRGRLTAETAPPKPRTLPVEGMLEMFDRFENTADDGQRRLRYVLALLLVRRKALKLHSLDQDEAGSYLVVQRPRAKETVRVWDPQLNDEQVREVEAELAMLLSPAQIESSEAST